MMENIKQSAGWLAPDGGWFPCKGNEHDVIAKPLCIKYYGYDGSGEHSFQSILEMNGWIRVSTSGMLTAKKDIIEIMTPEQASVLARLQDVGDTGWRNNLIRFIKWC